MCGCQTNDRSAEAETSERPTATQAPRPAAGLQLVLQGDRLGTSSPVGCGTRRSRRTRRRAACARLLFDARAAIRMRHAGVRHEKEARTTPRHWTGFSMFCTEPGWPHPPAWAPLLNTADGGSNLRSSYRSVAGEYCVGRYRASA